jgi:hypothetical protein
MRTTTNESAEVVRAALLHRLTTCWERLEDAVSELIELHGVRADEIADRIASATGRADDRG